MSKDIFETQARLMRASDQVVPDLPVDIGIYMADFIKHNHAAVQLLRALKKFREVTKDLSICYLDRWGKAADVQAVFYLGLIAEEFAEVLEAFAAADLVGVLDGFMDMQVVEHGAGHSLGLPMAAAWDEVARSNESKIEADTGKIPRAPDGKWIKPAGYVKPDLARVLLEAKVGDIKKDAA